VEIYASLEDTLYDPNIVSRRVTTRLVEVEDGVNYAIHFVTHFFILSLISRLPLEHICPLFGKDRAKRCII
jgi:hypothetical protein